VEGGTKRRKRKEVVVVCGHWELLGAFQLYPWGELKGRTKRNLLQCRVFKMKAIVF